jgi:hypothetical protein
MALHVEASEVQQWLQRSKLMVDSVDAELEATAWARVASALDTRFDTSTWLTAETTPQLVRGVVSMFIAAWVYKRAFAESSVDVAGTYGTGLESSAMSLLGGLVDGSTSLPGYEEVASSQAPVFWPTDAATMVAEEEGADADGAAVRVFSMGRTF